MRAVRVNRDTYPVFRQFLHYYLNELYDYMPDLEMDAYGNYDYPGVQDVLDEADVRAFLFLDEGRYKGFLILTSGRYAPPGYDYSIHELYVAKPYRRKGIAGKILAALFKSYPGKYFVMENERNVPAIRFWHHFYEKKEISYVEKRRMIDGQSCLVQTFLII